MPVAADSESEESETDSDTDLDDGDSDADGEAALEAEARRQEAEAAALVRREAEEAEHEQWQRRRALGAQLGSGRPRSTTRLCEPGAKQPAEPRCRNTEQRAELERLLPAWARIGPKGRGQRRVAAGGLGERCLGLDRDIDAATTRGRRRSTPVREAHP